MVEPQVGQGSYVASLHVHQDGTTLFGLVGGQGVVEGAFHNVLQLDVESGVEVVAVFGVDVIFRVDGHPIAMVYSSHQLPTVLPFEVVVVGAFDAEIVAFLFVGHAEHEAGEFLIGMVAADFLFGDDAAFEDALVENDELLHLTQFRLGDVQRDFIVTVLLGLAFGKEGLPLRGVSFREEAGHLAAERVDVFGKENGVDGFIVEVDVVKRDGDGHQLTVG